MATIDKRNGVWRFRVHWVDEQGNKHSKSQQGFKRKKDAEDAANELELRMHRGTSITRREMSLVEYWHQWYTTYKSGKRARTTEEFYPRIENQLREYFGDRQLTKVTAMDWQRFLNDYADGKDRTAWDVRLNKRVPNVAPRSHESVSKMNTYVRSMVRYAINEQIIFSDFTFRAELGGTDPKQEELKFLQLDQFTALCKEAYATASHYRLSRAAIFVGAQTGLRISELLGLTWSDIDFKNHLITVNKSWDYVHKEFKPTKNKASIRTIEVLPAVTELLRRIRAEQASWMMKTKIRDSNNSVFYGRLAGVLTDAAVNKALRKLESNVGISANDQVTFHGLRHTHVSYLLSQGVDIYYISKRLGHSGIQITLNTYSHLLDAQRQQQASVALDVLFKIV